MIFKIHDTNLDFRLALSNSFSPLFVVFDLLL